MFIQSPKTFQRPQQRLGNYSKIKCKKPELKKKNFLRLKFED